MNRTTTIMMAAAMTLPFSAYADDDSDSDSSGVKHERIRKSRHHRAKSRHNRARTIEQICAIHIDKRGPKGKLCRALVGSRAEAEATRVELEAVRGDFDACNDLLVDNETALEECLNPPKTDPDGFVAVPAGTFTMGSPEDELGRSNKETQHLVTLTRPFWMGARETTQGEFEARMGYNPSWNPSCGAECPVNKVSWHEAVTYANALSASQGLEECYLGGELGSLDCEGYRLPTEAEWEYAARAGTATPFPGSADELGWYRSNANTQQPGALKPPNAWGLCDTVGNVWEWTNDWRADSSGAHEVDPMGSGSGYNKAYRGGGVTSNESQCRSAMRAFASPNATDRNLGFRLARTILD